MISRVKSSRNLKELTMWWGGAFKAAFHVTSDFAKSSITVLAVGAEEIHVAVPMGSGML